MTDNAIEQIERPIPPAPRLDAHEEAWRRHQQTLAEERGRRRSRGKTLIFLFLTIAVGVAALVYIIGHPLEQDPWWLLWGSAVVYCCVLCLAASKFASAWRERLLALTAMWRPWAVVLIAGYFLYFVPQGRELGGSLMIGDGHWYLLRAGSLLFALAYWAINSWFSARRGIKDALDAGLIGSVPDDWPADTNRKVTTANTPWVFWGPRFVGVCAHLAAAISLGLAAWPDFDSSSLGGGALARLGAFLAAFNAFFAVLLLICAINWYDRNKLSQHGPRPPYDEPVAPASMLARLSYPWGEAKIAIEAIVDAFLLSGGFLSALAVVVVVLTTGAAALAAIYFPQVSVGFIVASGAVCLSALIYLLLISASYSYDPLGVHAPPDERRRDDNEQAREVARWTISLIAPTVAVVFVASLYPTWLGRNFGSMVIAFFAFGALLAVLNFFEWITERPNLAATRALRAYVVAGVLVFCIINAWLTPFHRVRFLDGDRKTTVDARLSVEAASEQWYDQARIAFRNAHADGRMVDGEKAPMVVVATAGGGIRAAYWTARVLDQITQDAGGLAPYIFAVSGVSGGSVGATAYATSLKDWHQCGAANASAPPSPTERDCKPGEWTTNLSTSYLADDYLAPALASWLFKDTFASLFPWRSEDRAVALENGIEAASGKAMAQSFIELRNPNPEHSTPFWSPILLLNATHEQTGKRIIASQARVDREVFVDALDELDVLGHDLRASTAAVNSARFTYVSPAGDLGGDHGTLIDGGYYENFGALTALEIAEAAKKHLNEYAEEKRDALADPNSAQTRLEWPEVKLTIVMITSDPDLGKTTGDRDIDASQSLVRIDRFGNEVCLANVTERGGLYTDVTGPNYLPDIWRKQADTLPERIANALSEVFENAWVNEFLAPFQGLEAVREAHGNRAASQLALQICTEYLAQDAHGLADTAGRGKQALNAGAQPAIARLDLPYFVHVGMCRKDPLGKLSVDPPLGWVLSKSTREGLDDLVCRCGNREQFDALGHATGAKTGVETYCEKPVVKKRIQQAGALKTPPPAAPVP